MVCALMEELAQEGGGGVILVGAPFWPAVCGVEQQVAVMPHWQIFSSPPPPNCCLAFNPPFPQGSWQESLCSFGHPHNEALEVLLGITEAKQP